ncbi:MAG: VapC toxin family PIN domain ribonuclease [Candidatus Aeolococcus gillhamiae]|uniref:Ribonuclease VapC n=1 Tax=Candidatus Aeolococcus gillhamiae TaxID=3127015 RepID=A0A2W5Z3B3_9BACT|nr:MAG: VapC toxin family PIN domain ribonuclease [Candidatus Dormibacter sp. RRmetagenome_bin12]
MSPSIVCDASTLVAMLVDGGSDGEWATSVLSDADLLAPHLLVFEAANVLRRLAAAGLVSADQAAQGHVDLMDVQLELWPYDLVAARSWQLRDNLSVYDASYVAVAELTGATLATLDRRIGRAPGLRCVVVSP